MKLARGVGYYHLHTREAYQVILNRIKGKKTKIENKKGCGYCFLITILCAPLGCALIKSANTEYRRLENLERLTTLRMNAAGPSSEIDVPPEILDEVKKHSKRGGGRTQSTGDTTGGYYVGDCNYFQEEVVIEGGAAGCG